MGCGHGFALMLDDQDISQVLPLANEHYEQGVSTQASGVRTNG